MAAASNYLETKIIDHLLRGIVWEPPTAIYISLHTATPNDTGAAEITSSAMPAYARKDAANGGNIANGWTPSSGGSSKNASQLIYAVHDGASPITVNHFGLWDAKTGGNFLVGAALASSRTLNPGDVFVIDAQKLTVSVL